MKPADLRDAVLWRAYRGKALVRALARAVAEKRLDLPALLREEKAKPARQLAKDLLARREAILARSPVDRKSVV